MVGDLQLLMVYPERGYQVAQEVPGFDLFSLKLAEGNNVGGVVPAEPFAVDLLDFTVVGDQDAHGSALTSQGV